MADISELLAKKQEIENQINELRKSERMAAVARIKALVADFDLSPEEIFGKKIRAGGAKVAPKYRDPATGKTWTGRGRTPRWLDGRVIEDFRIS